MIEKAKNTLTRKHLLIIGKSELERRRFINQLVTSMNLEVFRFPSHMKEFNEYYNFVKKEQLYIGRHNAKGYNGNQILDFHWDWISENNSLIIMEEFQWMEEPWRTELLRIYLNETDGHKKEQKKIHLILSQESENGLIEKLSHVVDGRENDRRTKTQIVEQNLELIDISEYSGAPH